MVHTCLRVPMALAFIGTGPKTKQVPITLDETQKHAASLDETNKPDKPGSDFSQGGLRTKEDVYHSIVDQQVQRTPGCPACEGRGPSRTDALRNVGNALRVLLKKIAGKAEKKLRVLAVHGDDFLKM
eukprot:4971700-Amphidinium_carterae.4